MIVDAHQHFWNLEREPLPWMTDEHARDQRGRSSRPTSSRCSTRAGVDDTCSCRRPAPTSDTDAMFAQRGAARRGSAP